MGLLRAEHSSFKLFNNMESQSSNKKRKFLSRQPISRSGKLIQLALQQKGGRTRISAVHISALNQPAGPKVKNETESRMKVKGSQLNSENNENYSVSGRICNDYKNAKSQNSSEGLASYKRKLLFDDSTEKSGDEAIGQLSSPCRPHSNKAHGSLNTKFHKHAVATAIEKRASLSPARIPSATSQTPATPSCEKRASSSPVLNNYRSPPREKMQDQGPSRGGQKVVLTTAHVSKESFNRKLSDCLEHGSEQLRTQSDCPVPGPAQNSARRSVPIVAKTAKLYEKHVVPASSPARARQPACGSESSPQRQVALGTAFTVSQMENNTWYAGDIVQLVPTPPVCSPQSSPWKTSEINSGSTPKGNQIIADQEESLLRTPNIGNVSFNFSFDKSESNNKDDGVNNISLRADLSIDDRTPTQMAQSEQKESDEIETEEDIPIPKKGTRRYIKCVSSARQKRKELRNLGKNYTTAKGKTVAEKVSRPLREGCRKKCFEKISPEEAKAQCSSLWALGSYDKRRLYVSSLLEVSPKKSARAKKVSPKRQRNRQFTIAYFVLVGGLRLTVCKECFLRIFDLSPKFLEIITDQKKISPIQVPNPDSRGHTTPPSAISQEKLEKVINHINSYPAYKSHYTRQRSGKKYLLSHLNLAILYTNYCESETEPVSRWIYEREFHKLGLDFKPPKADTCVKCDELFLKCEHAENEQQKQQFTQLLDLHHRKAEKAVATKQADRKEAKADKNKEKLVVSFNVQQCLPTPHLSSSVIFHKRQLWTYNLTVHDLGSKESSNYMWHEGIGERGANQIGSAMYHYISALQFFITILSLWSDTCGGQNKNNILIAALLTALADKPTLKIINHKFLVPGHTHMECDQDHGVIENREKTASHVHLPRDWYNLVSNCGSRFTVVELTQDIQKDFAALLSGAASPLVKRKKNTEKQPFRFQPVVWFQYRRDLPLGVINYKHTLEREAPFYTLDLRRHPKAPISLKPKQAYHGPLPINPKKKKDLLDILPLIDPLCRPFYEQLITDDGVDEDDPDLQSNRDSAEESDVESD